MDKNLKEEIGLLFRTPPRLAIRSLAQLRVSINKVKNNIISREVHIRNKWIVFNS